MSDWDLAEAQVKDLIRHIPETANAVVLVDAQAIFSSPIAKAGNWQADREANFAAGMTSIPPLADSMVIAADLDTDMMRAERNSEEFRCLSVRLAKSCNFSLILVSEVFRLAIRQQCGVMAGSHRYNFFSIGNSFMNLDSTTAASAAPTSIEPQIWWHKPLIWVTCVVLLYVLREFFLIGFLTFLICFIVRSLVGFLTRHVTHGRGGHRLDLLLTLSVFLGCCCGLYGLGRFFVPELIRQGKSLVTQMKDSSAEDVLGASGASFWTLMVATVQLILGLG